MSSEQLQALAAYSACDISDALLKLKVPQAGFLADIIPTPLPSQSSSNSSSSKMIAPVSTVLFTSKDPSAPKPTVQSNIPSGTPYADLTRSETIVLVSQPAGQKNAVVGGIMAMRMARLGAKGIVVDGRVRDLGALAEVDLPVWSRATSTVGAGAESLPWATDVPVSIGEVEVEPDDIVMLDPDERGAVAIPKAKLAEVLDLLPKITQADEKVLKEVSEGGEVGAAFKKYRG